MLPRLLAFLVLASAVQAQDAAVAGRVLGTDGAPLAGASVLVTGTLRGASTGEDGAFRVVGLSAGAYTLRVSSVGYQTQDVPVVLASGGVEALTVRLVEARYGVGDDVVVTATRTAQTVSEAPASISVVSGAELRTRPVGDLTDALRDLPGVSLTAGSQGRREIQLRGMDASYTLVLVDGKRVSSSEAVFRHNDFDIGLVPVEAIERIEVVRGAMSALYGSEALGGVINVITRPVSGAWRGGVTTELQAPTVGEGGAEGRLSGYASGTVVPDRLALRLTGGMSRRGAWHGGPPAPLLDGSGAVVTRPDGSEVSQADLATLEGRDDVTGRATLSWRPAPQHTVEVEGGYGYQSRFGEYYIRGWGDADSELDRTDVALSHRASTGWGRSQARAYAERVSTGDDGLTQTNLVAEGNGTVVWGAHALTAGLEARHVDLEAPGEFASGGASVDQQAAYVQDEVRLAPWLTVLGGARLDHHETFGARVTPRAYAVVSATSALTLKGGVGTAFKAPTLRQLSDESVVRSCRGACLVVGNADLAPETTTNVELGLDVRRPAWGGSVTAFTNRIDNLIDTPRGAGVDPVGVDAETGLPQYVPRNVNRARVRGLEATARALVGRWAQVRGNLTVLDARDLDADVPLDYRPRLTGNARVDGFLGRGASAFARVQHVGSQRTGDLTLDAYSLLDVGASVRLGRRFQISGGVQNVANTRTDDAEDNYSFAERGRTVSLGLTARF